MPVSSDGPDPLGRAMLDYAREEYDENCVYRDGDAVQDAAIREFYFLPESEWSERERRDVDSLSGPVLDLGCGAGRHTLALQDRGVEVLATDVSPHAVQAASERGVTHAVQMDMFDLRLPDDAYRSVLALGTQVTVAGSLGRLADFFAEVDRVTTDDATVLVDGYDPTDPTCADLLGYRADPREGLARRSFRFQYGDEFGDPIEMLLFSPERLRDALAGTAWRVADLLDADDFAHFRAVLEKA
ncbi:class I SAM-dependent methyltransferase [Salinirubrum litoreum]|uniref:Class I SAM-dependent methyltransferase n=1 Tax=Salinirubrum litoreum TaxID=1126234 RepID=A0ABD5R9U7_9EURY|nr:class I SAM-dependent methyltransferase [Salinirubrum litoreum]